MSASTTDPGTAHSRAARRPRPAPATPMRARASHPEIPPALPCANTPRPHCAGSASQRHRVAWGHRLLTMKLLFFGDDFRLGVLNTQSQVVDVTDVVKDIP